MVNKKINIKINNRPYLAKAGETILEVAKRNNIFIPSLCHHPDFGPKGNCRVCVVETKGSARLSTSCSTMVRPGLEIFTDSPAVKKSRNLNLELLFSEHVEKCPSCTRRYNCELLDLAKRYKIKINHFKERKAKRKTYNFASTVEIDGSQCIDCRNCIDACSKMQGINYLEIKGRGKNQEIVPTEDKNIDCIYCGQCALHCPANSAAEHNDFAAVEEVLKKKDKIIVAQFAPSVRVTIGEEFGLPYGKESTGKTVAALKKLGFSHVFDVNFGADVTTMVEAAELLERLGDKKAALPLLTSCCPAWVKYLEFYYPKLINHLTTSRSPHIHLGGIIKTYWAKKIGVDPKKIVVISVMPCTAKKFEINRPELKINNLRPVDLVITTREFAFLLKKNKIDFKKIKPRQADEIINNGSSAGVIYASSGGVMESALRTANYLACKNSKLLSCPIRLEFKEVRGLKGLKEATIELAGKKLRVAVVNGIINAREMINNLKKYDYVEIMACPGGCIGGGGQPIPTTPEIRQKRLEGVYKIDKSKKLRKAHDNKDVIKALAWLENQGIARSVLHTQYKKRT